MNNDLIGLIRATYKSKFVPDLVARGKPRMTQSDQWHRKYLNHPGKRGERARFVADWYRYVDAIKGSFANVPITTELIVEVKFRCPPSWSNKQIKAAQGQYHRVKPDADNILKGISDALCKEDQKIGLMLLWKSYVEHGDQEGITLYYK